MSTTGGVFSETTLANIQVKADRVWQDRIQKEDYVADVVALKAIQANQTATFGKYLTGKKDRIVEISWINACDLDDQACTNCEFDFPELSTNMDEKYLYRCRETGFEANEGTFHDNLYDIEEIIAKGMLRAGQVLDNYWATQAVVALNAAKGVNEVGTAGKGAVSGTDTYVLPAYWDAGLMSYLYLVAKVNRFKSPYLVSGKNLFESVWTADKEACCENDAKKFGTYNIWFDLFNIDVANTPDYVTYLINKGTFAFYTKAYYKNERKEYFDQKRWAIPSRNLAGVYYDVHYTNECNEADDFYTHKFKLKTLGDFFLNPVGCTPTRTGLLSFICGEPA